MCPNRSQRGRIPDFNIPGSVLRFTFLLTQAGVPSHLDAQVPLCPGSGVGGGWVQEKQTGHSAHSDSWR